MINMKILIINQHPKDIVGGSEVQCDLLASHLTRLGHEVVYFAVNGTRQNYEVPYKVEPGTLTWKDLRRIVPLYCPDLVYWRFNKRRFLPSVVMLKLMNVKIVFSISHINDVVKWSHKVRFEALIFKDKLRKHYFSFRQAFSSRINHFGYYFVDGVIAQLEQQTGKLPVRKERVIPNSVDATVVPFHWDNPFVVWVANIKPAKNPELFIKLAKHFQRLNIDFLMVGNIQSSKYHTLLKDSELPSNFHYLGAKHNYEINGILRSSFFLVHTCQPEGFPNVFIQAWMQGRPTVSLYYDPDRMIQKNHLGRLSGSFEQFVHDTEELIENVPLREKMGNLAKIYAEAHFSPEENVRDIESFFKEICLD